ncbi:MAG: hypothetical protein Hyperionvirus11_60 [Hyperionvirus sp.]|uniref:Uncharacterized protein n=1 Tax=Hyperionvirus sp. TaxID=2487770 RepID=A0A3G5A949_9VIRU|nr:MAG: hypothetical protein Hyperionvirus11_60 [Hyperionvirus sp.]
MSGWKKLQNFERISISTNESKCYFYRPTRDAKSLPDHTKKLNNTETGLICRFLSYAERHVFSITSKHFNNIFNIAKAASQFPDRTKHNLDTEIIRRLSDPRSGFIYEGTDINPVLKFLSDNDFYLTGSALLQIITGEKFHAKSDFDFISKEPQSDISEIFTKLRSAPAKEITLYYYPIQLTPEELKLYTEIYDIARNQVLPGETTYPFFPLRTHTIYNENLRTVQLSAITERNYKSVNEFIYHTADFDFTAISWSFKHQRLWARNFDSIILKQCSLKISDISWVNAYGCCGEIIIEMQMEQKGISSPDDVEEFKNSYSLHNIRTMLTRCKMRKLKYEHRGYSVNIEDEEEINNPLY